MIAWLESYKCGCQTAALRKRDLLGYCATHGNSVQERIKVPFGTRAEAEHFVRADDQEEKR